MARSPLTDTHAGGRSERSEAFHYGPRTLHHVAGVTRKWSTGIAAQQQRMAAPAGKWTTETSAVRSGRRAEVYLRLRELLAERGELCRTDVRLGVVRLDHRQEPAPRLPTVVPVRDGHRRERSRGECRLGRVVRADDCQVVGCDPPQVGHGPEDRDAHQVLVSADRRDAGTSQPRELPRYRLPVHGKAADD